MCYSVLEPGSQEHWSAGASRRPSQCPIPPFLQLKEILNAALKNTLAVLNVEGGLIYLLDETSQSFAPSAHHGISQDVLKEVSGFRMGGRSYAGVPIKCRGKVLGALILITHQQDYFRPDCVSLLDSIGNQIGVAIEKALLYEEIKQSERTLQKSQEEFWELYDNAPVGYHQIDTEGDIVLVNQTEANLLGDTKGEMLGRPIFDFVAEADRDIAREAVRRKIAQEQPIVPFERAYVRKDGEEIQVAIEEQLIFDEQGKVIGIRSMLQEVSARKRAEEQILRQSAILEAINNVFQETLTCETDEEVARMCLAVAEELTSSKFGFIGEVNQAGRFDNIALSNPGWDACRMPRSNAVRMLKDMEIRGIWGRTLKDEQSLIVNNPASHPDRVGTPEGHPPITSFLGVPLKRAGRTIGMIGLANKESGYDKADQQAVERLSVAFVEALYRKRAEEELQKSERKYRKLFEQLNDAVFLANAETGIILDANEQAEVLLGRTRDEIIGMHQRELHPPDKVEEYRERFALHVEKGRAADFEGEVVRKDNSIVPVEISGVPFVLGEQKLIIGLFRDITERKQAEEELRKSIQREMQAYVQGRLEVIETILHNIGNAITNVTIGIGTVYENLANNRLTRHLTALADVVKEHQEDFADYVQNNPQGQKVAPFILALADGFAEQDKRWQETVERVRKRAEYIADIVRTQKASNRGSGYRKEINLKEAINDAITVLGESINKRGIEIIIDCEDAPEEITIQEGQFHQMLVNLVKNSIEAIDELVAAKLSVRPDAPASASASACAAADRPFIKIRCYVEENSLILEVTDNGIGIEKDKLTTIFSAGYTTKKSGTGLGLHSIANFVQSISGQICALSDGIGKGATIRISIRINLTE